MIVTRTFLSFGPLGPTTRAHGTTAQRPTHTDIHIRTKCEIGTRALETYASDDAVRPEPVTDPGADPVTDPVTDAVARSAPSPAVSVVTPAGAVPRRQAAAARWLGGGQA